MSRIRVLGCVAVAVALLVSSANAIVIFDDNFAARPDNQEIFGTNPTTAQPSVGTYAGVLTFPFSARVDPFTPLGKVLKFDTHVGDDTQMVFLPHVHTFASEPIRLSITAAYDQFQPNGFNNFAIGFARFSLGDGHNIFAEHVLIQSDGVQFSFPGVNTTPSAPFTFNVNTFYTFELTYDPNLAGIPGAQPYTFSINGTEIPIPVTGATVYQPLTQIEYIAFGSRFSGGITTRYISNFKLELVPEPALATAILAPLAMLLNRPRRRVA